MNILRKFLTSELNIENCDEAIHQFSQYEKFLLEWNEKINLVSRKTDSIENHILNSIFFLKKYMIKGNEKIIDIGTGGGFPGIPLKILFPDIQLTLLDSITKKTMVVSDITEKLNINAKVITGRAEIFSKSPDFIRKFDVVISKAVASLYDIYDWGSGFLNSSGKMICIKGGNIDSELSELLNENKVKTETIDYSFPSEYHIKEKKIIILSK
jgi:16S rRNA (guanine527-N7)-methyltransferase